MKLYTKIVIDIDGRVVEEISTDYHGPVALAKGGGGSRGSSTTVQQTSNPTVDRLAGLGESFLSPALQGQSFQPVTGVRSMVEQQLMPLIPLMQQQLTGGGGAPGVFNIPNQINEFQSLNPMARQLATRHAEDVFNPMRETGLFTQSAERLLPQVRGGLAVRGIAPGGVGQGIENQALGNLALDFALRENQARQQAISQLQSVSGADLSERLQRAGGQLSAITGGQSALARGFQLPLDVLNQSISTELAPLNALTQLTGAASGGTQISTGTASQSQKATGGSGIFGK